MANYIYHKIMFDNEECNYVVLEDEYGYRQICSELKFDNEILKITGYTFDCAKEHKFQYDTSVIDYESVYCYEINTSNSYSGGILIDDYDNIIYKITSSTSDYDYMQYARYTALSIYTNENTRTLRLHAPSLAPGSDSIYSSKNPLNVYGKALRIPVLITKGLINWDLEEGAIDQNCYKYTISNVTKYCHASTYNTNGKPNNGLILASTTTQKELKNAGYTGDFTYSSLVQKQVIYNGDPNVLLINATNLDVVGYIDPTKLEVVWSNGSTPSYGIIEKLIRNNSVYTIKDESDEDSQTIDAICLCMIGNKDNSGNQYNLFAFAKIHYYYYYPESAQDPKVSIKVELPYNANLYDRTKYSSMYPAGAGDFIADIDNTKMLLNGTPVTGNNPNYNSFSAKYCIGVYDTTENKLTTVEITFQIPPYLECKLA